MTPVRVVVLLLLIAAGAIAYWASRPPAPPTTRATPKPTTIPTTAPATRPDVVPARNLPDVLRRNLGSYPATQPLAAAVPLGDAQRILLSTPVHLDAQGDLWVTHPWADDIDAVLARARNEQVHVVRQRVRHVIRTGRSVMVVAETMPTTRPEGPRSSTDALQIIGTGRRLPLTMPAGVDWDSAVPSAGRILVPGPGGVAVVTVADGSVQWRSLLPAGPPTTTPPPPVARVSARNDGAAIAYLPSSGPAEVATAVDVYINGAWQRRRENVPAVYVAVPLGGSGLGAALVIGRAEDGAVPWLERIDLELNEQQFSAVLARLAADGPDGNEAEAVLMRMGPGAASVLADRSADLTGLAATRAGRVVDAAVAVAMGGFLPVDANLTALAPTVDGGVLFHAPAGVAMGQAYTPRPTHPNARFVIRPMAGGILVPESVTTAIDVTLVPLATYAGEWLAVDPKVGLCRFMGNHFAPLHPPAYRKYTRLIGVDGRGRWIFRKPSPDSPTLIVDVTLADATPRLPTWTMDVEAAGWDAAGNLVIRREPREFAITGTGWEESKLLTDPPDPWPQPAPAALSSYRNPAGHGYVTGLGPAADTRPATDESPRPPALDDTSARWVVFVDSRSVAVWDTATGRYARGNKPPNADWSGNPPASAAAGLVFVMDATRKISRFRVDWGEPGTTGTLAFEATFDPGLPAQAVVRMWADPWGRVIVVQEKGWATLLFATGRVPEAIADLMPRKVEESDVPEAQPLPEPPEPMEPPVA